jgi:hypothetical protein
MSNKIKAGDLVQVVKPRLCCGNDSGVGMVFLVEDFTDGAYCDNCGWQGGPHAGVGGLWRVELPRLKLIPPLDELEDVKRDEEITA